MEKKATDWGWMLGVWNARFGSWGGLSTISHGHADAGILRSMGGHMGHPSPKYTAKFKQGAVRLYRERGTAYAEVARELGVGPSSLADWRKRSYAARAASGDNPRATSAYVVPDFLHSPTAFCLNSAVYLRDGLPMARLAFLRCSHHAETESDLSTGMGQIQIHRAARSRARARSVCSPRACDCRRRGSGRWRWSRLPGAAGLACAGRARP